MSKFCDNCPMCGSAGKYALGTAKIGENWNLVTIEENSIASCCTVSKHASYADTLQALGDTDIHALNAEMEHGGWDDEGYFIDNGPVDSYPYYD